MLKIVSTIVLKMLTILSRIVDTCWKKCSTLVYTIIDNYRNSLKFKPLFLVSLQDIFQPFFQTCCYMFQQCLNLNCSNKCPKIVENCFNACIKLPNTVSKLLSGLSLTQNGFNHLPLFNTECYLFLMPWVDSLTSTGIPHLLFTHLLFPGKTALWLLFFSAAGSRISIYACLAPLRVSCLPPHMMAERASLAVLFLPLQLSAVLWSSCLGSVSLFACHMHWVLFRDQTQTPVVWYMRTECHAV